MTDFRTPEDTLTIRDKEIFMSYARLLRVISLFPEGLPELSMAHQDPAVLSAVIEILMAEDGIKPEDYPRVESYGLTIEEGDTVAEWGLAHAFGFFARKVEATLEAAKATAEKIQGVNEEAEKLTNSMLS